MESSSESSSSSAGEASEGNVLDAEEKKDEIKLGKIIRTDFLGVRVCLWNITQDNAYNVVRHQILKSICKLFYKKALKVTFKL